MFAPSANGPMRSVSSPYSAPMTPTPSAVVPPSDPASVVLVVLLGVLCGLALVLMVIVSVLFVLRHYSKQVRTPVPKSTFELPQNNFSTSISCHPYYSLEELRFLGRNVVCSNTSSSTKKNNNRQANNDSTSSRSRLKLDETASNGRIRIKQVAQTEGVEMSLAGSCCHLWRRMREGRSLLPDMPSASASPIAKAGKGPDSTFSSLGIWGLIRWQVWQAREREVCL